MAEKKTLKSIKSGLISRGLSLAKVTVSTSSQLALHGITQILKDQENKDVAWKKFLVTQASSLTNELGELKGSLMKAGQMLSMYGEYFLPKEANDILKSLQFQSPPMEWEGIYKVLQTYLPEDLLNELEIDPVAKASASMGQVHKAKIKTTGEIVALKIQYPGVDKAIDSDLKAMKTLLGLLKVLPKEFNTDPLFAEIRSMLIQEMNYTIEAQTTIKFYELLKNDSRFIVPQVFKRYSNEKVIVTSWEEGIQPDDVLIKSMNQNRRNELAKSFLDLYFMEIFSWGIVQTDPHLGNYKVKLGQSGEKDQLILLDFGAVRYYPEDFMTPYHRMVKAALNNHPQNLSQAARELKFLKDNDDSELKKHFEEFCLTMVEPFISQSDSRNIKGHIKDGDIYDWSTSDLPERLYKIVWNMVKRFTLRSPPREVLFLDRKTGGVFIFLKVLGAQINGRELLLKYMNKIKE